MMTITRHEAIQPNQQDRQDGFGTHDASDLIAEMHVQVNEFV